MQNKNTLIFVPNQLKFNKTGYFEGFYHEFNDNVAYYITNNSIIRQPTQIIGYVGKSHNTKRKLLFYEKNLEKFTVLNGDNSSLIPISYDLDGFTNCDKILTSNYGEHFRVLHEYLQEKRIKNTQNGHKTYLTKVLSLLIRYLHITITFLDRIKSFVSKSAILSHLYDNLQTFKWLCNEIVNKKPSKIKIGNIIITKAIDLIVGVIILEFMIIHQNRIMELITEICDMIIENLKELLMYLMGSPIGLKLNKAFNNCLGKFFFHHISLWRVFLYSIRPIFERYFLLLIIPGILGFSYQIALLSDIISIVTFHVYCIYVYAARLIHLQLNTLLSLFRLFIGRKYNPLRQKVDSYQYSHHQLFIGVLGFTILFFLLPTTLLYYTVFTIFRLLIVLFEWILHRIRYVLDHLPIYISILWLCNSSELAGTLYIKWQNSDDSPKLQAELNRLSLLTSIKKFTLNNESIAKKPCGIIFKKIITGVLI